MALVASDARLVAVRGHDVTGPPNRGEITNEEVFPELVATWRGEEVEVTIEASRYRHSEGLSDWRIFVLRTTPGATPTATAAILEVCRPLVVDWLESDGYRASRRVAVAYMVKRAVRDDRYGPERGAAVLEQFADEVGERDRVALCDAVRAARAMHAALERVPADIGEVV